MAANQSLSQNQPQLAVQLFREFNHWYAEEESAKDRDFQEKFIRLWGFAELQAGSLAEGIRLLEKWLHEFPNTTEFRAFIRYQLASAHLAAGQQEQAKQHWSTFLENHSNLPESNLVRWHLAEYLIRESRIDEAISQLLDVASSSSLPPSGKALAHAALALTLVSENEAEEAVCWLESSPDDLLMSLWRSILAPSLADALLQAEKPDLALKSATWFDASHNLLAVIRQIAPGKVSQQDSIRGKIWRTHWKNQFKKASISLQATIEAGFDVAQLYRLRMKIFTRTQTWQEAHFLAKALLDSHNAEYQSIRQAIYCHAIEASMGLEKWDAASELVRDFMKEYPMSPDLPDILFLEAQCSAARKRWLKACRSIEKLISGYPDNPDIHAWRFAHAKWLAQSGNFSEALETLLQLKLECPGLWREYIEFEQASTLQQLLRQDEAIELLRGLFSGSRYPEIAQQAGISLLKASLEQQNWATFDTVYRKFVNAFPGSPSQPIADLLLGSFMEQSGKIEKAIEVYLRVATRESQWADHACHQLSRIYAASKAFEKLHQHATGWIWNQLASKRPYAEQPWMDCLVYQKKTGKTAFSKQQTEELSRVLLKGDSPVYQWGFLDLLADRWQDYAGFLDSAGVGFIEWLTRLASSQFAAGQKMIWSTLSLYEAGLLMNAQRRDSADAIRIRVLTTVNVEDLGEDELIEVAAVAHQYDFPESIKILERFLEIHSTSQRLPECLLMLAGEYVESGKPVEAMGFLRTIVTDWQDSIACVEASLLLADLQLDENMLDQATTTIERLLDTSGLSPHDTARSLLMRAAIDFKSGNINRCRINCDRILTLYPDIDEIITDTENLMVKLPAA